MKTAAIIAEYNPFHQGHKYQIQETRKQTGADFILVLMSGNFVQRGEPAVFEKSLRAKMALQAGADLVLELPAPFATASARDFAFFSVLLLTRSKVVDILSFGSEHGRLEPLWAAARLLSQESPEFKIRLKEELRHGAAFPLARAAALRAAGMDETMAKIIAAPNNLLGIEYLKALAALNSPIRPFTLQRKGEGYHSQNLPDSAFASASALRRELSGKNRSGQILNHIPRELSGLYQQEAVWPIYPDDCSLLLNHTILRCQKEDIDLSVYSDVSRELADRIMHSANKALSFSQRITELKTKQYTYTRVSRCLLHLLLEIKTADMQFFGGPNDCCYLRILGFQKTAAPLLKALKTNSRIPVITKAAKAPARLNQSQMRLWDLDIYCSHLYHSVMQQKYQITPKNEYNRPVVIL